MTRAAVSNPVTRTLPSNSPALPVLLPTTPGPPFPTVLTPVRRPRHAARQDAHARVPGTHEWHVIRDACSIYTEAEVRVAPDAATSELLEWFRCHYHFVTS